MIKVINSDKVKYYSCDCSKCHRTLGFDSGDIDKSIETDPFNEFVSYAVKTITCPVCGDLVPLSINGDICNNFHEITQTEYFKIHKT